MSKVDLHEQDCLRKNQLLFRSDSSIGNDHPNEFDTESNQLSAKRWNLDRARDTTLEKNLLLDNLSQALATLESIIDKDTLLKPIDLISIIKKQKFSWKFLRFLDTIKNVLEQSVGKRKFSSTN